MQIEKRLIIIQCLMFSVFLLLPLNYVLKILVTSDLINYGTIVIFVLVLWLLYLVYKKSSKRIINVSTKVLNINKYNMYVFIVGYIVLTISNKELSFNPKVIVFITITTLSAVFGAVFNIILLRKNKS